MKQEAKFFSAPSEFRKWLQEHHRTESVLLVGFYKVSTGKPSMTWSESVDEALCFGWIDGIRRSIDEESYCIRFTPRNPKSNWSAVNIRKVEEMTRQGKMFPAGLAAFEKRSEVRAGTYSYENRPEKLDAGLESRFQEEPEAWEFFTSQAPSYQKVMIYWVMSAKQEQTRASRLSKLIEFSALKERVR
ncbi:MAG: YdeI/OmpD-associated family protein [Prolixibacteraceae bacterium]|nr:YdeI/OmpD-associated family protein [Prolixibacteraceae bacterium]